MKACRDFIVKLFGRNRTPGPETQAAREIAQRIGMKADELNAHLRSYQKSRDPFAAMMADMYNHEQLKRLHRSTRQ